MARIVYVAKSRKPQGNCRRCGTEIKAGDAYRWWKPRYGSKSVRCGNCQFRPSEVTTSKLAQVYAAQENVEDLAEEARHLDAENFDLSGFLDDCRYAIDEIREVAAEYQEAADAIREVADNSIADENEEKANELDSWADELESVVDDQCEFDGALNDEQQPKNEVEWIEWRDGVVDAIGDAFECCPVD